MPDPKHTTWQQIPFDESVALRLSSSLRADPLLCRLLAQRGIKDPAEAASFIGPAISGLHNPFEMKDMQKAAGRLDMAIQHGEKILLCGDYDVDGTGAVSMMFAFLSRLTSQLDYYIPDRITEGYGLSIGGIEYARNQHCSLLLAMDCGIKDHEAVNLAADYGIDVIICDHHLPGEQLPAAFAVLDPKQPGCTYPFKELCGCGVAFKLVHALALLHNTPVEELASLLDLVAVSTACDIVPLTGENRILVKFGLQRLNRRPRPGLWALMESVHRAPPLVVQDLVFGLGPAINSAGRLGDARDAVKLMLSADRNSALVMARQLARRNAERRKVDYAMADEAREKVKELPGLSSRKSIVLFNRSWHKGIIGISASRIAEDFHKPTIILTESNGKAVGSARSVRGFDLYEAILQCRDLLFSYGGHAHAAGLQLPVEAIGAFSDRFEEVVSASMKKEYEAPVLEVSETLSFDQITHDLLQSLRVLEPFGPHNMTPVFVAEAVGDTGKSKILQNNHAFLSLRQSENGPVFTGMAFGLADRFSRLRTGVFDIAFSLKETRKSAAPQIELLIKGIRQCR